MKLDELFKYDEQYVKKAISETVDKQKVGFDYVGLSIFYKDKDNSDKIADFLVKYGLSEQYYAMLRLNKDLDIAKEFERVKKYGKCYGAIANFLSSSERKYCEYKVIESGKAMDIVKYILTVNDCDKVALSEALVKTKNANAIAYALKYIDDFGFKLLQCIDVYVDNKQQKIMDSMLQIIQDSSSEFAKKIAYETIVRINSKENNNTIAIGAPNVKNEQQDLAM